MLQIMYFVDWSYTHASDVHGVCSVSGLRLGTGASMTQPWSLTPEG